jgi:uncharacterized membrane protein
LVFFFVEKTSTTAVIIYPTISTNQFDSNVTTNISIDNPSKESLAGWIIAFIVVGAVLLVVVVIVIVVIITNRQQQNDTIDNQQPSTAMHVNDSTCNHIIFSSNC